MAAMRHFSLVCWLVLGCAALGAPSLAAGMPTLNVQIQLDAGVIRVGDIWHDAGGNAAAIIGTAPLPGHSITVDGAQLGYIARLYNVEWKPTSGVERTIIERPGRTLTRDEIVVALRRRLAEAGAPADSTVELTSLNDILVPPTSSPVISVQDISFDAGTERFSATLLIAAEGMATENTRVAGRAVQLVDAVVATRRLSVGQTIGPDDVKLLPISQRRVGVEIARDLNRVVGQAARHTLVSGQPVPIADIGAPILVEKGGLVMLSIEMPGMSIAAQGRALDAGGRGDTIQVMNPMSHAVLEARVSGPGQASVVPGSTPVVAAAGSLSRSSEVAQ